MYTFSLAEAKAQLSRLVDLVESGHDITITKRGKAVAKLVRNEPRTQNIPSLSEHRAKIRRQSETAADLIRRLRDTDRF
jgi:prevent-host-death family protein